MTYLDANATTPPDPEVVGAMLPWLTEHYGNPSASHAAGRESKRALEKARRQVATLIGATAEEIVFTSGATESINTVILFAQREWPERPLLIISAVEPPFLDTEMHKGGKKPEEVVAQILELVALDAGSQSGRIVKIA